MSGQRLTLRIGAVSIKTRKWPVVAAAQATGKLALTPKTFSMEAEAWSPYAFCDRNSFAEKKIKNDEPLISARIQEAKMTFESFLKRL